MDSDGTLHSIGEPARRTGLTVKTVRFHSDRGIVPPTDRSPAGHRRYGPEAVARLGFVRTLRDLGLDLVTVRGVVDRELSLPEVASAHASALAVQIHVLRLRQAVLTAAAERGASPEETELMHRLARLTEAERRHLVDDFLDTVFEGLDTDPAFAAITRTMTPEPPDDPGLEQVRAWVELAELSQDPDFRTAVRRLVEEQAGERAAEQAVERTEAAAGPRPDVAAVVRGHVNAALSAGIEPESERADPVVAALTAYYAGLLGRPDDAELRRRLATRLEVMNDPRRDRYFQLLAIVNGWSAPEDLAPVLDWSVEALRVRSGR